MLTANQALELAYEVEVVLKWVRALKAVTAQQLQAENRLTRKLEELFGGTLDTILRELRELGFIPGDPLQQRQLIQGLINLQPRLAELLGDESQRVGQYGKNRIISKLQQLGVSIQYTPITSRVSDLLRTQAFIASETTLDRMVGDVLGSLAWSYDEGYSLDRAAELLEREFKGMKTWQLERIARTEVIKYQNLAAYETELELGVEYHQWWTGEDEWVRGDPAGKYPDAEFDHSQMHGQIVRVGDPFIHPEQGWEIMYPGDPEGDLANIINCRCHVYPFLLPEGKRPPLDVPYFYEDELEDMVA